MLAGRLFVLFLLILPAPLFSSDNITYVYRDPVAWGAIYKYCIACHSAKVLDDAESSNVIWSSQIDSCVTRARFGGYPAPTKKDVDALKNFLPLITPQTRLIPPKRGSLATP